MSEESKKMNLNATWSMAVGGMVGGGIFSVLGVIIATAGQQAWISFLLAGLIALISGHSYSQLSVKYKKCGGAFTYLNEINHEGVAGSLSWVLILGYIFTISVYAFTFGHYVAHLLDWGSWFPRVLAFAVITVLAWINLQGVTNSAKVEIITVWGKLLVLIGLSAFGLAEWNSASLTNGIEPKPWSAAIVGAVTIFMAYEGFQLLSYDYADIKNPQKNLPLATISAIIAVIVVYLLVTFGATMVVGAETLIEEKEVALSVAGRQAAGITGLVLVTIAAAFSTGSAINDTLFSTGRLMQIVAKKNELPGKLAKQNEKNMPYYAILIISAIAAALAIIGSLEALVDSASLIFLITFGAVNFLAYRQKIKFSGVSLAGTIGCVLAIIISAIKQYQDNRWALFTIAALILFSVFARPFIIKRMK